MQRAVHILRCPDQLGVLARISQLIARKSASLINCDIHIDIPEQLLAGNGGAYAAPSGATEFHSRTEFLFNPSRWSRQEARGGSPPGMDSDFALLGRECNAINTRIRAPGMDNPPRMGILCSKTDHCLMELLYRAEVGELPAEIACVISNHMKDRDSAVMRMLERQGVPFYYVPTQGGQAPQEGQMKSFEPAILSIAHRTDFLVLARYMQVLTGSFLKTYGRDVINIHHGLLPSFKGKNPYRQAYMAGVKVIGATSHFVTEELDAGPIIEQITARVTHRDSLATFADKSQMLEKQCLARAVHEYLNDRVVRISRNRVAVLY